MPVHLNSVLASKNTLAVDTIAASMLRYGMDKITPLRLAAQVGLGPTGKEEIHIISPNKIKGIQPEKKRI